MWKNDPKYGQFLSGLATLLSLCIAFLVPTLPLSAVLHIDPVVTAGVIATLATVLTRVLQARERLEDRRGEDR